MPSHLHLSGSTFSNVLYLFVVLSNDHTSEQEWFFFAAQDLKYSNSRRSNRATKTGYWKSTGKDRKILAPRTKKLIGTKKTLVFYSGRVSNGIRTNWVIHEYQLHSDPQFAQLVISLFLCPLYIFSSRLSTLVSFLLCFCLCPLMLSLM